MKMVKCDRCGHQDDGAKLTCCGGTEFYAGSVERYEYSDQPRFLPVDLCRKCNGELDAMVSKWMRSANRP